MIKQLDTNIYVAWRHNSFFGLHFGVRMTLVRTTGNKLWVHSPIALDPELLREVEALGEVAYIVAPNKFHHLWAGDWCKQWPNALLYAAPGLDRKRKDLTITRELAQSLPEPWPQELQILPFAGAPAFNEFTFFHGESNTLICTDLVLNILSPTNWFTKAYLRFSGILGKTGVSKIIKLSIKDKREARASIDAMHGTHFQRLVMAHGDVVETRGCDALREAFAWL